MDGVIDWESEDLRVALVNKLKDVYLSEIKKSIPSTVTLSSKLKHSAEAAAFDIFYGSAALNIICPDYVHYALSKSRSIHYHYEKMFCDAQNILLIEFKDEEYYGPLLLGDGSV